MATEDVGQPTSEYIEYTPLVRWIVLAAVMLGTVLEVLDISIVNVAIPDMMGNLGATLDQIGWVSTGYIVANVIFLPLTGWLSRYFGRRRYLGASIILFTVASVFCGLSRSLNELVFFRILQGAGGAALLSTAQATLFEIFPPNQIPMIQAIFGIGVMVGPTVGPTLGGWITDNYSWPWVFFINVPIGIAAAILTLTFMHESRYHVRAGKVDVMGIALLAVGVGSLQIVLERGNREMWFQSNMIAGFAVAAAIGIISFIFWELRVDEPAVNLRVLKHRGLAAGASFATVLGFGLYGGIFILPIFLQELRGYSAAETGWIIFPGGMATAVLMPITGRLMQRYPPQILVAIGAVGFIISMWMLHYITLDTGPEHMFWPLVLRGASMGFLFLPLTLASLSELVGKDIGSGTGLFNLARQLGGSAGIAFLSTYIDDRHALHRSTLVQNINEYGAMAMQRMHQMMHGFMASGSPASVAKQQAYAAMERMVEGQSLVMAYEDAFLVIGIIFVCALPLVFLLKSTKPGGGPPPGAH